MIAETSPAGSLVAANNLRDLTNLASAHTNLGTHSKDDIGSMNGPLQPRGGVAFDGSAGVRVIATLTNQNIGTDDFSFYAFITVPTSAPSTTDAIMGLSSNSTSVAVNNAVTMRIGGSGQLNLSFINTIGVNVADLNIANFVTTYGGKRVHVAATRSGSTVTVYINATSTAFVTTTYGTGTVAGSITSTYLLIGSDDSTRSARIPIYSATLYNCALSAADVQEIYELGGAVPERFKFGSQTTQGDTSFGAGSGNWINSTNTNVAGNIDAVSDGSSTIDDTLRIYADAANGVHDARQLNYASGFARRGYARIRFRYFIPNAQTNVNGFKFYTTGAAGDLALVTGVQQFSTVGAWTSVDQTVQLADTPTPGTAISGLRTYIQLTKNAASTFVGANSATDDRVYLAYFTLNPVGAVVHLPLNDGIGYQLHDESTNKLDAVMTTTGVSHILPRRRGYVRGTLTWAGTNENRSIIGQRCLPNNAVIDKVTTKATAASTGSGLRLVDVNDLALVLANAYTTAKKSHALNLRMPSAATDNATNLCVDPDNANYTGSIQVEVQYSSMEGNP